LPALEVKLAKDVLPNDIVWGIQWQDNLRKGFLLDNEGVVCELGAKPLPAGQRADLVQFGYWAPMPLDRLVLVEVK
jgi:hypothetical protein